MPQSAGRHGGKYMLNLLSSAVSTVRSNAQVGDVVTVKAYVAEL